MANETPALPGPGTETNDQDDSGQNPVAASVWTFLSVLVALLALGGLVVYAGENYTTVQDTTTLLGVVVPAVVSIGAAAFGIRIAYDKGETSGSSNKETELKAKLQPLADQANRKTKEALEPVVRTLSSPAGSEDLVLRAGDQLPGELRVPGQSLRNAQDALAELKGAVKALG